MFCRNCGKQIDNVAAVCVNCGVAKGQGSNFCPNCGNPTSSNQAVCTNCGVALGAVAPAGAEQKSKLAAGLLGIFLGGFGVHNFYLGYTSKGIIQVSLWAGGLILSLCTFGLSTFACLAAGVWGLIEGIMILAGSITVDANGVPLKD